MSYTFWLLAVFSQRLLVWGRSLSYALKHRVTSFSVSNDLLGYLLWRSLPVGSVATDELISCFFLLFKVIRLNLSIVSEFFSLLCLFRFSGFNLFFSFFRLLLFLSSICILGSFFGIFDITLFFEGIGCFNLFLYRFCWFTISRWLVFFALISSGIS